MTVVEATGPESQRKYTVPDLTGWEAYCAECEAFRQARRAREIDASNGSEYFEFVCARETRSEPLTATRPART